MAQYLLLFPYFTFVTYLLLLQRGKSEAQKGDPRWPNKQLNVLLGVKSLNSSEQQILAAMFDQIEHKTCVKINKLSPELVNPFDTNISRQQLEESERNFIYLFKSDFGSNLNSQKPSLGLSSFGCIHQGRQSVILTDLAFKFPELVLRYHILRSLAVQNLKRPDEEVRKLLNVLPLSQKISNEPDSRTPIMSTYSMFTYASLANRKSPLGSDAESVARASANEPATTTTDQLNNKPADSLDAQNNNNNNNTLERVKLVKYLSEQDLERIKELYNCAEFQNKLSLKPLQFEEEQSIKASQLRQVDSTSNTFPQAADTSLYLFGRDRLEKKEAEPEGEEKKQATEEPKISEAAKSIAEYLLKESNESAQRREQNKEKDSTYGEQIQPQEACDGQVQSSCSLPEGAQNGEREKTSKRDGSSIELQQRPMLLKLDEYHAQDPQLQQANQMKLSQPGKENFLNGNLLNTPELTLSKEQQDSDSHAHHTTAKSEMVLSFEQSDSTQTNPIAALASSKVLKLCSCTCQTMAPLNGGSTSASTSSSSSSSSSSPSSPSKRPSTMPTFPSLPEASTSTTPSYTNSLQPDESKTPMTPETPFWNMSWPTTTTTTPSTTSAAMTKPEMSPPSTTTLEPLTTTQFSFEPEKETTTTKPSTTTTTTKRPSENNQTSTNWPNNSSQLSLLSENPCELVQWVRPNKTVYSSAKIVWDVDRANQNYFLCNNYINNEIVPGKTHGFSCKISNEGKAYELHNFNVLIKPEHVNLAWVQKNSDSFGTTNLPVIGGFSKTQDPYIVSRCLVRDENNDMITLIGYVNNQGVGWFPFDDIQIECANYDVLACVN